MVTSQFFFKSLAFWYYLKFSLMIQLTQVNLEGQRSKTIPLGCQLFLKIKRFKLQMGSQAGSWSTDLLTVLCWAIQASKHSSRAFLEWPRFRAHLSELWNIPLFLEPHNFLLDVNKFALTRYFSSQCLLLICELNWLFFVFVAGDWTRQCTMPLNYNLSP